MTQMTIRLYANLCLSMWLLIRECVWSRVGDLSHVQGTCISVSVNRQVGHQLQYPCYHVRLDHLAVTTETYFKWGSQHDRLLPASSEPGKIVVWSCVMQSLQAAVGSCADVAPGPCADVAHSRPSSDQ